MRRPVVFAVDPMLNPPAIGVVMDETPPKPLEIGPELNEFIGAELPPKALFVGCVGVWPKLPAPPNAL